jgi:sensor histidine kinase YesM
MWVLKELELDKSKMNFLKELKNATIVFLAITVVFIVIHFLLGYSIGWEMIKETLITNSLFTYAFYFSNLLLNYSLNKWMPWNPHPKRRAIAGTIITILVNLIVICIVITVLMAFVYGGDADYIFTERGKGNVLITFVVVTVITLIFYTVGFFQQYQEERLVSEKLRKEKIGAELNALKSQVDPHFLFNSFNVLSGLIDENPPQAQKFLGGLSKIYRYVLENRNESLVTLEEELKFAEQYLKLQKIRFENGINVDLQISPESLAKKLPALSLQLLLENAITHNGFDAKSPLTISISSDANSLVVKNNKRNRIKLNPGSGMGLKNIEERYNLQSVEGFKIEDTEDYFIVHLPLITS